MSSHRLDSLDIATVLQGNVTNIYYDYIQLSRGIQEGDLEAVKSFLNQHPDAVDTWINLYETPLLKACAFGENKIVMELLSRMTPEQIFPKISQNKSYHTPLTVVAAKINIEAAKALVTKNPRVLEVPDIDGNIPVVVAVENWREEMARYLYTTTPTQVLFDNDGYHGIKLLTSAISSGMLDIALDLFGICRRLAVIKHPQINLTPVTLLASKPELIEGHYQYLGPLKRFLYHRIQVELPSTLTEVHRIKKDNNTLLGKMLEGLLELIGIDEVYQLKVKHLQIQKLVHGISEETLAMGIKERDIVDEALRQAVISGNVEFLIEMVANNSELLWCTEKSSTSELFFLAIVHRQRVVLNFLSHQKQRHLLRTGEWSGTRLLDLASLPPADRLATITGAAAQMQSEMKWFSDTLGLAFMLNNDGPSTSRDTYAFQLFKRSHEPLRKEAEKSMKDMAGSYSLVAALVVTITFAAVFTVPGGTDDNSHGKPFHLNDRRFMIFIVSDMISCLTACTSVLIFLGILTSRYHFEDFVVSLPTKMIAGLLSLFVSIAAMLTAFWSALFTTLNKRSWFVAPVVVVACCPAIMFFLIQFPLLREMIHATFPAFPARIIYSISRILRFPLEMICSIREVLSLGIKNFRSRFMR